MFKEMFTTEITEAFISFKKFWDKFDVNFEQEARDELGNDADFDKLQAKAKELAKASWTKQKKARG